MSTPIQTRLTGLEHMQPHKLLDGLMLSKVVDHFTANVDAMEWQETIYYNDGDSPLVFKLSVGSNKSEQDDYQYDIDILIKTGDHKLELFYDFRCAFERRDVTDRYVLLLHLTDAALSILQHRQLMATAKPYIPKD